MMSEIEGVAGAMKVSAVGRNGETQHVTVRNEGGWVRVVLSACSYPADLTPQQARHIARCLRSAATRAEKAKSE